MKLITTDEQLRLLIPNVLATAEGEPTLIEKLYPFLETAEQWAIDTFVPEAIFDEIAADDGFGPNERFRYPLEKLVACQAYMTAIPSLDLVLTPNGFGIVSNQNIVPASRERVEQQSAQGKYFGATMFPLLNLCRRLAIREHIWDSYQQLHERLIKIENVLADTYFSQEQMQVFRSQVIVQYSTSKPIEEQIIRSLQAYELQLLTDIQVHPQCYYDLVTIIRERPDDFPAWHASPVADLYTPKIFQNKKNSSAYWF